MIKLCFHLFVGNQLACFNLPESFLQTDQKLGFLRDLLEFRAGKFRELCHDFIETHPWILAYLDGATTLNLAESSGTNFDRFEEIVSRPSSKSRNSGAGPTTQIASNPSFLSGRSKW